MLKFIQALRDFPRKKIFWPLVTLAVLLLINLIITPHFFVMEIDKEGRLYGVLIDILNRGAPLMLLAIGMTLVIATKGIDLSVSSVVAVSGAMAALLIVGPKVIQSHITGDVTMTPMWLAILAALGVAALCGAWNGLLVSRVGMQPIIATLILYVAGRGIAQLITDGQIITIYYIPYFFIGNGTILGLPFSIYIVALVFIVTWMLTRRTALGLFIESVGINPMASHYSGIKSKNITFWVYVFAGLCAGIAGLIVSSNVKCADGNNAGVLMELDAILAVVLGGTALSGGKFYLGGSIIGAIIIQTLTSSIYAIGIAPEITLVVKAIVVYIVSLIQSEEFRRKMLGLLKLRERNGV